MREREKRLAKGRKIRLILEDSGVVDFQKKSLKVLDVGCSTGVILGLILSSWPNATGVGVDIDRYAIWSARRVRTGAQLLLGDGMCLPFNNSVFDVVICSQVYEHIPEWLQMLKEIYRVLRPGGVCFFSGPNRWWIIESHYGIPLLSWFPRRIADLLVRLFTKHSRYYERPVGWFSLMRGFASTGFDVVDYTWRILERPGAFGFCGPYWGLVGIIVKLTPRPLRPALTWLSPNFNVVLVKRGWGRSAESD